MSNNIWVSSDLHLNHANILRFTDSDGLPVRPGFSDVDEMNEYMLERHNSVVKPGDKYYCLGDVFFGYKPDDRNWFKSYWPKFNGSKRLIVGNHDDIKFLSSGGFFQKVYMWRMMPEFNLLLSHVPLHLSSLTRGAEQKPLLNVHGHTHSNGSPVGPYKSVCVEMLDDYTPINLEELRDHAEKILRGDRVEENVPENADENVEYCEESVGC